MRALREKQRGHALALLLQTRVIDAVGGLGGHGVQRLRLRAGLLRDQRTHVGGLAHARPCFAK